MLNEAFGSNPFNVLPHIVALLVAYVLAIPIGWNREQEERSAGLRTFPLVAVATCGFVQASETFIIGEPEAMARIMEGLITGMGFIGGGAILRQQDSVKGTATAASLWVTGAIGASVIGVVLNVGLTLAAIFVASKLMAIDFGSIGAMMLKSTAMAILAGAVGALIVSISPKDMSTPIVALHVVVILYWVMFYNFFEIDLQETLMTTAIVTVFQIAAFCIIFKPLGK